MKEYKHQKVYELSPRMSFRTGSLEQDVIIFCPVTGIVGKLEMPWLPVNLSYTHPLSKAGNALLLVRKYKKEKQKAKELESKVAVTRETIRAMFLELDRQVLAGCVLSLLQDKKLLKMEAETTMVERNLVLQNAGSETLASLLYQMEYFWDNAQVWKRMPHLNIEYLTFRDQTVGTGNISEVLNGYTKILREILNPHELSSEERAKIFAVQKREQVYAGRRVKIYSASAVQHKRIKETKTEAYEILETLRPHLSIVLRSKLVRVLREMLILPMSHKQHVASELGLAKVPEMLYDGKKQLIQLILASDTSRILEEIGTLSQEVSPKPMKSIAEILAVKKAKAEDKQEHQEERERIEDEFSFYTSQEEPIEDEGEENE